MASTLIERRYRSGFRLRRRNKEAAARVSRAADGSGTAVMTEMPNLALACVSCSLRKGARRTAKDPQSGKQAPLFHPRDWRWTDHFRWIGVRVEGISPTGRATVALLRMNREIAVAIRAEEVRMGRHPAE
jgi:hypothetical protein